MTKVLVREGFGKTKDLLIELRQRDDFVEAAKTINENEDSTEGEYFDIRSLISDDNETDSIEDFMNLPDGTYGGVEIKHF